MSSQGRSGKVSRVSGEIRQAASPRISTSFTRASTSFLSLSKSRRCAVFAKPRASEAASAMWRRRMVSSFCILLFRLLHNLLAKIGAQVFRVCAGPPGVLPRGRRVPVPAGPSPGAPGCAPAGIPPGGRYRWIRGNGGPAPSRKAPAVGCGCGGRRPPRHRGKRGSATTWISLLGAWPRRIAPPLRRDRPQYRPLAAEEEKEYSLLKFIIFRGGRFNERCCPVPLSSGRGNPLRDSGCGDLPHPRSQDPAGCPANTTSFLGSVEWLRFSWKRVREVYGIDPFEETTLCHRPAHRKDAREVKDFEEVFVGVCGKREENGLAVFHPDGTPFKYPPCELLVAVEPAGALCVSFRPFIYQVDEVLPKKNDSGGSSCLATPFSCLDPGKDSA